MLEKFLKTRSRTCAKLAKLPSLERIDNQIFDIIAKATAKVIGAYNSSQDYYQIRNGPAVFGICYDTELRDSCLASISISLGKIGRRTIPIDLCPHPSPKDKDAIEKNLSREISKRLGTRRRIKVYFYSPLTD